MRITRHKSVSKRHLSLAMIIGAISLLIVFAFVVMSVAPVKYDVKVGEVASVTLTATREVTDEVTTLELKEQARAAVSPKYTMDNTKTEETLTAISDYYSRVSDAAAGLRDAYITKLIVDSNHTALREELIAQFDPSSVKWHEFLSDEHYNDVRSAVHDMSMPDESVLAIAALGPDKISQMENEVARVVNFALESGIRAENIDAEKSGLERNLSLLYPEPAELYLAYYPVNKYLNANMIYDAQATTREQNAAAEQVAPVTYKQNQTVVVTGEVVTQAQYTVLERLGLVGGQDIDYVLYIGHFLLVALLYCIFAVYLYQFEPEILAETRKVLVMAFIIVIVSAIALALAKLDTRIIAVFFGTMLASVLVSQRSALVINVLLAALAGIIATGQTGILSATMLMGLLCAVAGGSVSVFALHKPGHRSSLITAGLFGGGAAMVIVLLVELLDNSRTSFEQLAINSGFALGSGLLGGVLSIGTLPIWEAVFRISTPAKLLELSNPNHPLLKRLTVEAPGTYHHSILTANLAEAGADAVDANALLCRVASYFHDVGKLGRPRYFAENQKGENPHDALDPRESVKVIKGHVEKGLELAQRYKLPREVQKIIAQHHGDGIIPYFYHKALEAGIEPKEDDFRYKGSRPSSKESAIMMLADCVEAAVRSMDDPDRDQVKDMIDKIIREKYNDGQLDDCPLSRRDLSKLAQAFLQCFDGALHERVKYPGQE